MSIAASVYILACNSARYLPRVLDSVREFAEIVIVDSGSQDETLDIAEQYGCRIYRNEWPGFAKQKAYAKSLCSHDWLLDLDSDEEVDLSLLQDIKKFLVNEKDDYEGLEVRIHDHFLGYRKPGRVKCNTRIKFYRADCGDYDTDRLVHETVELRGRSRLAKGFIIHHGIGDIATRLDKINRYSSLRAEEKSNKSRRPSLLRLVLIMPAAFIKAYFIKRSLFAGCSGFINSMIVAFYAFLKEAKLYELNINKKNNNK